MKHIPILLTLISVVLFALPQGFPPGAMPREALVGVDPLESADGNIIPAGDIFSCYFDGERLRVRLPMMVDFVTKANEFERLGVHLEIDLGDEISINIAPSSAVRASQRGAIELVDVDFMPEYGTIDLFFNSEIIPRPRISIRTRCRGEIIDEAIFGLEEPEYTDAHCAFVHHGNQSLSYTDVLRGRSGAEASSGFDEILEVHQLYSLPGNFHMSGTIQSGAAWYDPDFNTWLADGVDSGWVEMLSSAYAQHIMPFVSDEMNDWSVAIEGDMVLYRYGFEPRVAWVPERTFLDGPGGDYPNAGVSDWIADDFIDNDIWAVILDDNIHLSGHDNHRIHTQSGSTLRLIPRDETFTGALHAGDWGSALAILQGLGSSTTGDYRIVVYADDWEMAAEMGEWASSMSTALDAYERMLWECSIESSWLHVWKLTDAVLNTNFDGETFTIYYGSHGSIGGIEGYGGASGGVGNQWYLDWAGYASPSDHRGHNFGTIWNDAKNNLLTCVDNNTSQAGWFVLMSNLYETGWHDGLGGAISGWEMKHSTHIKNANTYAEGSRWAADSAFPDCGAIYDDWDDDGDDEIVIYNNRVCAVFEHIGGRGHYIFAKGGTAGWEGSIAGNCNAYWEGTEGDYNDANHIAPLSDVAVGSYDYQHNLYSSSVDYSTTDSAQITLGSYLLKKTIKVKADQSYMQVHYDTGPDNTYIKSGFTPDLVDVVWNCEVDRLWGTGYCGFYNPNTHASAAIVYGGGGASHSTEFQSTILKGDEVTGRGGFGFYVFAGELDDVAGLTSATLNALAAGLTDNFPPRAYYASYHPGSDVMEISFGDLVRFDEVEMANIGVDGDGDGVADVLLDVDCTVINTADARHIRIQISPAKASAIEALSMTDPHLYLLANAFVDVPGNGNLTQTATVGDAVVFNVLPNTSITIDGWIDTTEWVSATRVLDDPDTDSEWGITNEIYDLNLFWDATYLYLGLHGVKESDTRTTNAWLIYLDTDPGGPNGAADLTAIDNWNRNAQFSGGFKADIQYGSWGSADGDVWHITSATTSTQIIDGVIVNTDLTADRPGSEVAISWDAIFGLGSGIVPTGAQIAMCASIAGGTDLGGDCVPNQLSAVFPILDNFHAQIIDGDGDGIPDDFDDIVHVGETPDLPNNIAISAYPNPFNSAVTISLDTPVGAGLRPARVEIFDIAGRRVTQLPSPSIPLPKGEGGNSFSLWEKVSEGRMRAEFTWQPDKSITSGVYLVRARFVSAQRPIDGAAAVKRVVYLK